MIINMTALKNIFNKIMTFFANLLEKDVSVKIGSLIAAVIIWFIVITNEYPIIPETYYNIPISIAMEGTYAEAHGYQPISQTEETVTVYVKGERREIGNMKSEELIAVASAENVMLAMEYSLPLKIESTTGKKFDVESIEPSSVKVAFDKIITKEFEVKPRLSGVRAAEGCIMGDKDDIVIVPNTVNVTGPAEIIESITDAAVVIRDNATLADTTDFKASAVSFFNGSTIIDAEGKQISFDKSEFTVHVPVLEKRTLALDVKIANAPESFNVEAFKAQLEFSVSELDVAVPSGSAERTTIDMDTIDMRKVEIGSEFSFETENFLPEGYQDLNEVHSITVKCPSDGLVRRSIHFTNGSIQLVNAPAGYDFNIMTSGVTSDFIGTAESMEQLTYIDIIAQIDMLNSFDLENGAGYQKLPVTFVIPFYDDVWCVGADGVLTPRVTIEAKVSEQDNNS